MRPPVLSLLKSLGLPRLATIVITAIITGLVVGYSLATLADEDPSRRLPNSTTTISAGSRPIEGTGRSGPVVVSADLLQAETASGRRRGRARLAVTVEIRNRSVRPRRALTAPPSLLVGTRRVIMDRRAVFAAGGLLKAIPPLTIVTGVLRFETAGEVTQRLVAQRRARLRIGGRTLSVEIG